MCFLLNNRGKYIANDMIMLNIFVLLYADDTIVLTENACELQKPLDAVHEYSGMYKLTVNSKKTKIIVFSRRIVKRFPTFKCGYNTGVSDCFILALPCISITNLTKP